MDWSTTFQGHFLGSKSPSILTTSQRSLQQRFISLEAMPILKIITNVPTDTVNNSDTLAALSKAMVEGVGKPEQYVLVTVDSGKPVMFAGTEEPAAFGELFSIGAIGGDKNKQISKIISDVVSSKLGVPSDRFYLSFHDAARSDMGWKGSTFA